ncbi:hypothetical protein HJG60_009112 [Phyllostomus discolor]|uniref:Uncharacterized protein n=1 Tax=Phyllostomus discolor TaxID=89673 RepID=A0A834DCT5_9CHIR|nr:hypothetical protein HJG60_009112 [Phyllostomus discolor]
MLSGPGRARPAGLRGCLQLPAPALLSEAESLLRDSFQGSYVLNTASEEPPGGLRGRPEAPGAAEGRVGEADVAGQRKLREDERVATLGGRRRPGAPLGEDPGGAGRRAFPGLLSELSPLPVGWACPASPAPSPARSREMFIWAVA